MVTRNILTSINGLNENFLWPKGARKNGVNKIFIRSGLGVYVEVHRQVSLALLVCHVRSRHAQYVAGVDRFGRRDKAIP
jgi:hypothetical protein